MKRAAVVVGYSSGKAASVHRFEEKELELLYEEFKLLRRLFGFKYHVDGSAKEEF